MGELNWYKRDPKAALAGMAVLTLEECGAYNLILDLIYSRDGDLPDDDRELARLMRCDVRVWRRIRRRLMDLGKLYVHGGHLHNARADDEINYALGRIANARAAGLASAAKRTVQKQHGQDLTSGELRGLGRPEVRRSYMPKLVSDVNRNNGLNSTGVKIALEHTTTTKKKTPF